MSENQDPGHQHDQIEGERSRRERGLARRTLLQSGWTVPIILAVGLPSGVALAHSNHTDNYAPRFTDTPFADFSSHTDTTQSHLDAHTDEVENHLDVNPPPPHTDIGHTDDGGHPRGTGPHGDSLSGHTDISRHFDQNTRHTDGHSDQLQGHGDTTTNP